MEKSVFLQTLGVPALVAANGVPIHVKTRKCLAILVCLFRAEGQKVPREEVASLFWSGASRDKSSQSLRQALSQIRSLEKSCGVPLLKACSSYLAGDGASLSWDLELITSLLEQGDAEAITKASKLWEGAFLAGYENLDPAFKVWLEREREQTSSFVSQKLFQILEAGGAADEGKRIEATAEFLLKIQPGHDAAHQALIDGFLRSGQNERAEHQSLLRDKFSQTNGNRTGWGKSGLQASPRLTEDQSVLADEIGSTAHSLDFGILPPEAVSIRLPKISIASVAVADRGGAKAQALRDEIVNGLSSFQSFDLYQFDYENQNDSMVLAKLDDGELGSYLLRLRSEAEMNKVYLQFEDRQSGKIVFNDVVDLNSWRDPTEAGMVAFQSINRIQSHVIGRLRNPRNEAPFAKWCQAEALIWEFSAEADTRAKRILKSLEASHPQFSLAYAGLASIQMKQMMYYPSKEREALPLVEEARALAEKAVFLDPWQPHNQRVFGWSLILSGAPEDAGNAFSEAGRLNRMDPGNQMSVAEGLAAVGRIGEAKEMGERALSIFSFVPRVFYEYMANIYFAAGEYDRAIETVERAPLGSLVGLATRVASLMSAGREDEARSVLELYRGRYDKLVSADIFSQINSQSWDQRINIFQNAKVRENYMIGANMVRQAILGEI